jgi:hypothetical protein
MKARSWRSFRDSGSAARGCLSTLPHPRNLNKHQISPTSALIDLSAYERQRSRLFQPGIVEGAGEGAEIEELRVSPCF